MMDKMDGCLTVVKTVVLFLYQMINRYRFGSARDDSIHTNTNDSDNR